MRINNSIQRTLSKVILSILLPLVIVGVPVSASALSLSSTNIYFATGSSKAACDALSSLDSSQGCGKNNGTTTVSGIIKTVINILTIIIGAASVIMIIISGLRFILSGGDSGKVSSAKTALIYALIGLALVALAQTIVHFALDTAVNSAS